MATPYKAVMVVKNSAGQVTQLPLAGDDVTAHALTFPDSSSQNKLSSLPCWITDFICTSTSITQIIVYINGVDTGIRLQSAAACGATTYFRQVMSSPIYVPAGANVSFYQLT